MDWFFEFMGHRYPHAPNQTIHGNVEPAPRTFEDYSISMMAGNPVVFAASDIRMKVFSQGTFRWRDLDTGKVRRATSLNRVRKPWPGGTESRLLSRMINHADPSGNAYVVDFGNKFGFLRPDWVTIVLGSNLEPDNPSIAEDAEVLGYVYKPPESEGRFYFQNEVAHFAPFPDPLARFRGMSWMTPIIREVQADKQATDHKLKFFESGATPNMIVSFDATTTPKQIEAFKKLIEKGGQGIESAYKTLYLGGGADATVVGANMQQMEFAATQGKAETRILMAAGVHPVIAGASEGMQGASLNAGNFNSIRRLFSDIHLQYLWEEAAAAMSNLLKPPNQSHELVVIGDDMPFLQDDAIDQATINKTGVSTIAVAVRDGFEPQSAIDAVVNNDLSQLKHTGMLSVQLQPPGTVTADPVSEPKTTDNGGQK
jgi:phage portal protein BeeE